MKGARAPGQGLGQGRDPGHIAGDGAAVHGRVGGNGPARAW